MKPQKLAESSVLGILFSRPPVTEEVSPIGWQQQISDVLGLAKTANTILSIYAHEGAGKTTFLRQLSTSLSEHLDTVVLNPSASTVSPGWISLGLAQWMTSDFTNHKQIQSKLAALKDTDRPILVCIDGSDFINPTQLSSEIGALVNFADASGLKLSVLVCSTPERAASLHAEANISNRIIFSKPLEGMSESELSEIIIRKIRLNKSLEQLINVKDLPQLARKADGSPMRMIHALSQHLGLSMSQKQSLQKPAAKVGSGKSNKKSTDESISQLDDLLAPPSK